MQFHSLFQLVYSAHPHLISIQSNQEMNIKFSLPTWHRSNNIRYYQFIINYPPPWFLFYRYWNGKHSIVMRGRYWGYLQSVSKPPPPSLYPSVFYWKRGSQEGRHNFKKMSNFWFLPTPDIQRVLNSGVGKEVTSGSLLPHLLLL